MPNINPALPDTGKAIAFARKLFGMTQQELADASGFARKSISQFETGHRGASGESLQKIAEAMGIPQCYLHVLADNSKDKCVAIMRGEVEKAMARRRDRIATERFGRAMRYHDHA